MIVKPQLVRIARLVATEPAQLQGLDDVPEQDLRTLHDQISESYFAAGREQFAKVVGLSKVLPSAVAGVLAERFLPPVFGARTAELLEPAKARDLVTKMSVRYLADLSILLDPSRAAAVVRAIPPERIGEVAAELFRRREYVAMAEFAGILSAQALTAALDRASSVDLIEMAPLIVWTDAVDAAYARLPASTIAAVLAQIVDEDRWTEGNVLLDRVPDSVRERAASVSLSPARLERFRAADRAGRVGAVGQDLLARLSTAGRKD